jgi:N6-L-threonylcarbamoyladenine synthase
VLGIESSCDECAAAIVEDGERILSSVVATQIEFHRKYEGVVPEIASRKHVEWIQGVVREAFSQAAMGPREIDGIAVTTRPGLMGALLVGLSFAKGLALALGKPLVGVNHMLAHLYAPRLAGPLEYPFVGLLASGGHTILCVARGFDEIEVLGTTIDDAAGEAFDKVAKFHGFGYPGGAAIDALAANGDPDAYRFPKPSLHKGEHRYDVSYSGLKTAAINQLASFLRPGKEASPENVAASFRKAAIDMLVDKLLLACADTGIKRVVAGGGVAANSYLRARLAARDDIAASFPPLSLCGDNGAMVAGLGCRMLERGDRDSLSLGAASRVPLYRKRYP